MTYTVAVDPSVKNIGLAILQIETKTLWLDTISLDLRRRHVGLPLVLHTIALGIRNRIRSGRVTSLIAEYPQYEQSERGIIAAQQGYTLDLAAVCGYLAGKFQVPPLSVHFYTPVQWKGQRPKSATEAAFKRQYSIENFARLTDHEVDACMMLHYHQTKCTASGNSKTVGSTRQRSKRVVIVS